MLDEFFLVEKQHGTLDMLPTRARASETLNVVMLHALVPFPIGLTAKVAVAAGECAAVWLFVSSLVFPIYS
jgi:hypothetical protein